MINDDYPPHDIDEPSPFANWDDHDVWENWGEPDSPDDHDDPIDSNLDYDQDDDDYNFDLGYDWSDEEWDTVFEDDVNAIDPEDALAHVDPDADITDF